MAAVGKETLALEARLVDPDGVYERLLDAHEGLSADASARFNARLILILVNHIGDPDVLDAALELAGGEEAGID